MQGIQVDPGISQDNLGVMYQNGDGVPQDFGEAVKCLDRWEWPCCSLLVPTRPGPAKQLFASPVLAPTRPTSAE